MYNKNTLEVINDEIEIKREQLNQLVLMENSNSNDLVLKMSKELDNIINLYYESIKSTVYSKHIK